jgi:hypothetical protein
MNVDEIKAALADLDVAVVPVEDPYGRLLRRRRRSRRNRAGGLSAVVALIVAFAFLSGGGLTSASPPPSPSASTTLQPGAPITPWIQRLMDSPTAGSLATDSAFLTTLLDQLTPGDFGIHPQMSERLVLFAGDVGSYRAVLMVFHDGVRQYVEWLVGDAGTTAAQFVHAAEMNMHAHASGTDTGLPYNAIVTLPAGLRPFSVMAMSDPSAGRYLAIGMAPAGCQVATSPDQAAPVWTDAPGGNVVTLSDPAAITVRARVTCAGVVRQEAPITANAQGDLRAPTLDAQQIDAALVGVRADAPVDRSAVAARMPRLLQPGIDPNSCRALYVGHLPGAAAILEPVVLFTACRTAAGNTFFQVVPVVDADSPPPGLGPVRFHEGMDPVRFADPTAVLAVRGVQQGTDPWVLVLAPANATTLQATRSDGTAETVPLVAGVGSVHVLENQRVQLVALNAAGAQVGVGTGPMGEGESADALVNPTTIENWS